MQNPQNYSPVKMGESRNMIAGLYDLEETIGEGHYAVVKLARYEEPYDLNLNPIMCFAFQACVYWREGGCESD